MEKNKQFKERMNLYRAYRKLNPDKNYWDWKASIDNAGKLAQQFRTRTNKPNFVRRLEDPNRQTIPSWENDTSVATHRLSYTTFDDGSAVIYPEVQQIGTKLYDFTDPTNRQTWKDAYQSALNRGDVVWVPTEQDAIDYTTQYKNHYPTFSNGSREVPAMQNGGNTVEDYITQQILAVRDAAYQNSLDRTMPRVPYQGGLKNTISKEQFEADKIAKQTSLQLQLDSLPKQLNPATGQYSTSLMYKHVEDALTKLLAEVNASAYQDTNNGAILPSCIYTATDNYGEQYLQPSTVAFMQQAGKNGFREIPIGDVKKGDIVIRSENGQNHGMLFDGYDAQGKRLYNHSNGGHTAEAIRKHAKYPATDDMLRAYEFVGTAKDSARWINEYEKLLNNVPAMQCGGNTEDYAGQLIDLYALKEAISQTGRNLYIADHTDPNTGVISPFYNKNDDTYGTYQLPELTTKPEYKSAAQMERALNAVAANRGRQYYYDAMREIDAGRRIAELAEWTPAGDIIDLTNAGIAAAHGDYLTAGMMAGMMFVPGFIQNPGKLLYRGLRNNGISRAAAKHYTKHPDALIYGIENNEIPAFAGKSKDEIRTVLEQYGVSPGLAADLVEFPYTTLNTIQKAPDLSTFAKKRKFLLDVHDTMDDYLAVAQRLNDEDFALRRSLFFPQYPLVANRAKWNVALADFPINTDVALNSVSFKNNLYKGVPDEKIPYGSSGVTRRVNQHVSLLDPVTGIPQTPSEIAETAVHEVLHARTRQQPEFEKMQAYSKEENALVFAGDVPGIPKQATDIFNPLARWIGIDNYNGSISEWFSRKAEYEAGRSKKHFREMAADEQNEMVDYMYMYFGKDFGDEHITKDDIRKMLTDGSAIGFKYGGIIL